MDDNVVVFDSGCTRTVCNDESLFTNLQIKPCGDMYLADNKVKYKIAGKGTIVLRTKGGGVLKVKGVAFIPEFPHNYLSPRQLRKQGYKIKAINDGDDWQILRDDEEICRTARDIRPHYGIKLSSSRICKDTVAAMKSFKKDSRTLAQWHRALNHVSEAVIKRTAKAVNGMVITDGGKYACESCDLTKLNKRTFSKQKTTTAKDAMDRWDADTKGILKKSRDGDKYYLLVKDHATDYMYGKVMKSKNTTEAMMKAIVEFQIKTGKKLKNLHTDNGREFMSHKLQDFLRRNGTHHSTGVPDVPEQQGKAERALQTVHRAVLSTVKESNLPKDLWHYAFKNVVQTFAYIPTTTVPDKTPYERMFKTKPRVNHLLPFGCIGYCRIPDRLRERGGFGDKANRCRFLCYDEQANSYVVLIQNGKSDKVSRVTHVKFYPDKFKFPDQDQDEEQKSLLLDAETFLQYVEETQNDDDSTKKGKGTDDEELQEHHQTDTPKAPGRPRGSKNRDYSDFAKDKTPRPQRNRKTVERYDPSKTAAISCADDENDDYGCEYAGGLHGLCAGLVMSDIPGVGEPKNYREANAPEQCGRWKKPQEEEIMALEKNNTWRIVKRPANIKLITTTWVYKEKRGKDGKVYRLKARLCARGFSQEGVTYSDSFAPTSRAATVRAIIAFAAKLGFHITQADVDNAFLHGLLKRPEYMEIPLGLRHKYDPALFCCELIKSLYGLKVAARCWDSELAKFMDELGFVRLDSDPCVYVYHHGEDMIIVSTHIDDLLIASNSQKRRDWFIAELGKKYGVKDEGDAHFLLGIEIVQRDDCYLLKQGHYVDRILEKFKMVNCHGVSVPLSPSHQIDEDKEGEAVDDRLYRSLIGCLNYISVMTRPDISYSLSKLARYVGKATMMHWEAAKHVLRYLKHTRNYGLRFPKGDNGGIVLWADADYGGCMDTRKCTSGNLTVYNGALVSWRSKRQPIPAKSTAEAEYISLAEGMEECLWLRNLLAELGEEVKSIPAKEDNQACIHIAENPKVTQRTKAIDMRYHYARHYVRDGLFKMEYVQSKLQLADVLTKAVTQSIMERFRDATLGE